MSPLSSTKSTHPRQPPANLRTRQLYISSYKTEAQANAPQAWPTTASQHTPEICPSANRSVVVSSNESSADDDGAPPSAPLVENRRWWSRANPNELVATAATVDGDALNRSDANCRFLGVRAATRIERHAACRIIAIPASRFLSGGDKNAKVRIRCLSRTGPTPLKMITQLDHDEREPDKAALDPHLEELLAAERDVPKNATHDGDAREDEEFAEEDAWLRAGHFLDETNPDDALDATHYTPQLMDVRAMNSLRTSLRKSEAQIEMCGRMREFVPRKPAAATSNGLAFMGSKRCGHARGQPRPDVAACVTNTSVASDLGQRHPVSSLLTFGPTRAFLTAAPSTAALAVSPSLSHRKEDFAVVLRRELYQLRGTTGCTFCVFKASWRFTSFLFM
ncbi:hypothetical protein FI667_g5172, partial [Globisporangium splendens]